MFDFLLFSLNGALCAAAFGFAAFVRHGRQDAMALAAALFVNFVACGLEYTQYAPRYALAACGWPVGAPDVWMMADTAFGVTALLVGSRHWWGTALWALSCVQVIVHLAYTAKWFDQYVYSDTLQVVLLAQLAVFFVIGGPRAADHLRSGLDRLRRPRRALAARACDEAAG